MVCNMCFFEADRFDKLNNIFAMCKITNLIEIQLTHFFNGLFLNYALVLKKRGLIIVETV